MIHRQGVHGRAIALVLGIASAATLLAACSSTTGGQTPQPPASASANVEQPSSKASQLSEDSISTDSLTGHVHNLLLQGDTIYLGTHDGIWAQKPGQQPQRVSEENFDVMGLTHTGSTWLASGHPGPEMQAPADLGLGISTDGGRTWIKGSLGGQVDFHRLVAQGSVVMGIGSADGGLWRTDNLGLNWQQLGTPPLFDIAIATANPDVVIATTQNGVVRSIDGGTSFASVADAPMLALVSSSDAGIYGASIDGNIYFSTNGGKNWQQRGNIQSQPTALAAQKDHVVALVGDVVVESTDSGRTFHDRLTLSNANSDGT